MREIKFRAWCKMGKCMVDVIQCSFGEWIAVPVQVAEDEWELEQLPWNDIILMQYTGLKDKNGKEIYEGDIVSWNNQVGNQYEVYFINGKFMGCNELGSENDHIEVIGNIYENSDLLKEIK